MRAPLDGFICAHCGGDYKIVKRGVGFYFDRFFLAERIAAVLYSHIVGRIRIQSRHTFVKVVRIGFGKFFARF